MTLRPTTPRPGDLAAPVDDPSPIREVCPSCDAVWSAGATRFSSYAAGPVWNCCGFKGYGLVRVFPQLYPRR